MKVLNIYPEGATKLWHRKSGDVVRIHKNDISIPDNEIYIVTIDKKEDKVYLTNLVTGERKYYHTSTRCTHYKKAAVYLHSRIEEE